MILPQTSIDYVVIGRIYRQTIVNLDQKVHERLLSGPALYAAAGLRCWAERVGVISRTSPTEKTELEKLLHRYQVDQHEIEFNAHSETPEQFLGYTSSSDTVTENPIPFFTAIQKPIPKSVLASKFQASHFNEQQNFYPVSLASFYLDASAAHICAAELSHQLKISTLLNKTSISVLTLLSDKSYMIPTNWGQVMNLMNGITAFITNRSQLSSLFKNRTNLFEEMAKIIHTHGCMYLVLNNGQEGYELIDIDHNKNIRVPAYLVKMIDPTGMDEAFCGGFLAGLRRDHDPVQAMLQGTTTASLKAEGSGAFFPMDATPGLLDARMGRIRDWVKVS